MSSRSARKLCSRTLMLLAAAGLVSWAGCLAGVPEIAAHLGPALLLLGLLAGGMYPGERVLARIARSPRKARRRPAPWRRQRPAELGFVRRSRLLAYHLAVRPPPVADGLVV